MIALPRQLADLPVRVFAPDDIHQHPLTRYYSIVGWSHGPQSLAAVDTDRAWRRGPDFHRLNAATGATDLLTVLLRAPAGMIRNFVIARIGGRDFRNWELRIAARLQPLLVGVDNHLHEYARLRAALPGGVIPADPVAVYGLTPRELTVLALLAESLTAAAIARRLAIGVSTVNTHLERIYRKLGTNDRLTSVLLARDAGLVPRSGHARPSTSNAAMLGRTHP
jgi:DNA-binding CsgD family transcriptional regulator